MQGQGNHFELISIEAIDSVIKWQPWQYGVAEFMNVAI